MHAVADASGGRAAQLLVSASLVVQYRAEQPDVADGQAQDLVLAELLVRRVGGHQAAQVGERAVHVLLSPSLAAVGEHAPRGLAGPAVR